MTPKLITFDCANTLIWTDWTPDSFAIRCCEIAGVALPPHAGTEYLRLLGPKMNQFLSLNKTGSYEAWRDFWVLQIEEWLSQLGVEGQDSLELHLIGEREIFETPSHTFKSFADSIPALTRIKNLGIPMAVISNWDLTLDKCLRAHGIYDYFDQVWASLVFGAEKPDPRFFEHAYQHFSVEPHECIHIGDLVEDDFEGARAAGMHALLLDRAAPGPSQQNLTITSLSQIEEAFDWFD